MTDLHLDPDCTGTWLIEKGGIFYMKNPNPNEPTHHGRFSSGYIKSAECNESRATHTDYESVAAAIREKASTRIINARGYK